MSPHKNRKRTLIVNLFLSLFIFLLLLLSIEFILRSTHLFGARISWAMPDPVLGWRNTPNFNYWNFKENDHPITGTFNSFGWRDSIWTIEKPDNTYRIAAIGDSYVEAFQVESDKSFLGLTQQALNKTLNISVELMNFGQSGFTQTEEFIILKNDVSQFSPDMVILFFLPNNDIEDINKETASSKLRPFYRIGYNGELLLDTSFNKEFLFKFKSFINPLKQHSALISLFAERYNAYAKNRRAKSERTNRTHASHGIGGVLSLATDSPDPIYLENYNLNKVLIKKMADFCKERGIRFMLVTLDINSYIPEIEKQYRAQDSSFDSNFFDDNLRQYAKSLNIEYIGLQSIFRDYYESTLSPLHWGHLNYKGHEVVSNALVNKLDPIINSDIENIN